MAPILPPSVRGACAGATGHGLGALAILGHRMQYTNLGSSGLKVSRLCLGCMGFGSPSWREWVLPEEPSRVILRRAVELGFNFVCLPLKLGFDEFRVGGGLLALEDSCADLDRLTDECVEALTGRLALSSKRDRGVVIDCEAVN